MLFELQHKLRDKKVNLLLLINTSLSKRDPNSFYLSGVDAEHGLLAVPAYGKPFLAVPGFEYERMRLVSRVGVVKLKKRSWKKQFGKKLGKSKVIGINKDMLSLREFSRIKKEFDKSRFKDFAKDLKMIRSVKTKEELQKIKKACRITDVILQRCIRKLKGFRSEKDVALYLETETRKHGCGLAFPPIVASGMHAGFPHHDPTSGKLLNGFCIIDFGVKYQGYCSDITRTVFLGRCSNRQMALYEKVLRVQTKAITLCKAGVRASDIFSFAEKELGKEFTHGLGHGIGVEIHEGPNLGPLSKEVLKDGMVFTVEPGVYSKKYGIRIEDDVYLVNGKCKVLTKTSKKLIIV